MTMSGHDLGAAREPMQKSKRPDAQAGPEVDRQRLSDRRMPEELRPQHAAPVGAGQQGRSPSFLGAQRRARSAPFGRRRVHRGDQDSSPRSPSHWLADPAKLRRGAGHAARAPTLQLAGATAQRMLGAEVHAGGRAGAGRQPLQGPRLERQPLLRFLEAGLSRSPRAGLEDMLRQDRGPRRAHAPARRVLPASRSRARSRRRTSR